MTQHVLFVCTGNICRSPLAAALLERALKEHGLDENVTSAGTGAWDGAPASECAYLVGLERGLDLSGHRARLLTRELVGQADLILTMARHHRARVDELGGEGRVFVLGEYVGRGGDEVSDPFGGDREVYRDTCQELEALAAAVAERLAAESKRGDQRSEEHTSELQSRFDLVCRLLLEKKKKQLMFLYPKVDSTYIKNYLHVIPSVISVLWND